MRRNDGSRLATPHTPYTVSVTCKLKKTMAKLSKLNIEEIFRQDAQKIIEARNRAKLIHNTSDIKAAGNEIEEEVRSFLRKRMPSNYYVGHGHIVDSDKQTSPQFDVLISDNTNIPILLRSNDTTEYFPCESVYAIGEIKSSYNKSDGQIKKFCESMKLVKGEMKRELIYNTAFNGQVKNDTLMRDMILSRPNKVLNALYSFMLFIDSTKFDMNEFEECISEYGNEYLPNHIILLDKGVIFYGDIENNTMVFERYPEFAEKEKQWLLSPFGDSEDKNGNHLSFLYWNIMEHLNSSLIEPTNLLPYFNSQFVGRKSTLIRINKNEA